MRRLAHLTEYLPSGSAVWCAENGVPYGTTQTDVLLMDVFQALTGEQHPANPRANGSASSDDGGTRSLVERLREQRERIDAKEGGSHG